MSCFGAAQLTVEADERLGFGPAGRAGYIRARRTASRRLQTLPPKKLVSRGKRRAASVLAREASRGLTV